jgi:cellulose synthase/poly-beta-1,6-N-acetylglucosamine synthase-like glycosyltransferase
MIPGALVWSAFAAAILASFFAPLLAVVFIIMFDLYWLFRIVYFVVSLMSSWGRYRVESKRDWFAVLRAKKGWEKYHHVIFLPTYKEPHEVIRTTFDCLLASSFPTSRMIIVLAGEERDKENFLATAELIRAEYGAKFFKFFVTVHPKGLPDEMPGKGSNLNWAGNTVKPEIDALGLPIENIIVSSFDVDTCVLPEYFSYLTSLYMDQPDPTRASYQPIPLFNNNMWDAPAPIRVAAFGTTFWLLNELGRPESLMTFSSHSMSWKMLTDVGFWQKDMVSEDSRIFLQGLVHYHGDYRVVPMYIGVNMDNVEGKGYWDSLVALYKQQRRWAYGVENFPFMVEKFSADPLMPWRVKARFIFFQLEGMFTWATAPILIFILGRLPLLVASTNRDALVQSAPFTLEWIMRLAMVGVFASGILSFFFLPHRPPTHPKYRWLIMVVQWAVLPVTFVLFGALPAIDAQTRLMFGKYLGFNVTAKQRKQ